MNKLKILKKSKKAIIKQGVPCLDNFGDCVYQHNNLRCGIGAIILQKDFDKDDIDKNIKAAVGDILPFIPHTVKKYKICQDDIDFLEKLQSCHDDAACEAKDIAVDEGYDDSRDTPSSEFFKTKFIELFKDYIKKLKKDTKKAK